MNIDERVNRHGEKIMYLKERLDAVIQDANNSFNLTNKNFKNFEQCLNIILTRIDKLEAKNDFVDVES